MLPKELTQHASETAGAEEALATLLTVGSSRRNIVTVVAGDRVWTSRATPSWLTTGRPGGQATVYVCLEEEILLALGVEQASEVELRFCRCA
jgi:hypothetical protein